MASKWQSVSDEKPEEGKVVEVLVAQGYTILGQWRAGKWCNLRGEELLSAAIYWRAGDRTKLDAYVASGGK